MFIVVIDLDSEDINLYKQSDEYSEIVKVYFKMSDDSDVKRYGFTSSIGPAQKTEASDYKDLEQDVTSMFFGGEINIGGIPCDSVALLEIFAFNRKKSFKKKEFFELYIPLPPKPFKEAVWDGDAQKWVSPEDIVIDPSTIRLDPSEIR